MRKQPSLILLKSNRRGSSLVEVIIAMSIFMIMAFAMISFQEQQLLTNNYLEFQFKRTQLQNTIVSQFLNNPANCACLFAGADPFPISPSGITLTGVSPTEIGQYQFSTPGDCSTAIVPQPLINSAGVDGLRSSNIRLTDIRNVSGIYTGVFFVNTVSVKKVTGPQNLVFRVPVIITATPSGPNAIFNSCAINVAASSPFSQNYTSYTSPARVWNTDYVNSLNRPLFVAVTFAVSAASATVNGVVVSSSSGFNSGSGFTNQLSFIVPPNGTYRIDASSTFVSWTELN